MTKDIVDDLRDADYPALAFEAADEIERWRERARELEEQLRTEVAMRPQWAQGYTDDSVAAQLSTSALHAVWRELGVDNQTDAMQRLAALKADEVQILLNNMRPCPVADDLQRIDWPEWAEGCSVIFWMDNEWEEPPDAGKVITMRRHKDK